MDETNALIAQHQAKLAPDDPHAVAVLECRIHGQKSIREVILVPQSRPVPPPTTGH